MPKRDWQSAREKVERERFCRVAKATLESASVWGAMGGCSGPIEAAHIVGREHDKMTPGFFRTPRTGGFWPVSPERIVPLCSRHHQLYDDHKLDLLGYLMAEEEAQAVLDCAATPDQPGLEIARRRLCPSAYREDTSFISTPEEMAEWERTEE